MISSLSIGLFVTILPDDGLVPPDVQANGTGRRQCTPSVAIGLLMAPLAVWFALDYLQITPRPEPPKIVANPEAAKLMAAPEASPPPLPSPPPPKPLEDWQLVRCAG